MLTDEIRAVALIVERGIDRCEAARRRTRNRATGSPEDEAQRCDRIADLFEREARWWEVLITPTYQRSRHGIPRVYGVAVIAARHRAELDAEQYREHAARWREIGETRARKAVPA